MNVVRRYLHVVGVGCALCGTFARDAMAQTQAVARPAQQLRFDRPEAWAMTYVTSTTLLSGLDAPDETRAGSVTIGLETGWLPRLDADQQRVGYYGTTRQDLNKAPIVLRPRVRIGLPWRLALVAAVVPPVRSFGVTPRLVAASLEGPLLGRDAWTLGWRAYGQLGTITSAVTCSADMLGFPLGSANNRLGCETESADVATLRYAGAELRAARRIARLGGLMPHIAAGVNLIDGAFQANARLFGYVDRTRLESRGVTFSLSTGVGYPLTRRVTIAADAFYSPLTVQRTFDAPRSTDPLVNARALISYRVH
jgi:hypothetical protein